MGFSPSSYSLYALIRVATNRIEEIAPKPPAKYRSSVAWLSAAAVIGFAAWEMKYSFIQSQMFSAAAANATYKVEPGPYSGMLYPEGGPYDQRLGYARLQDFLPRLRALGYQVEAQARPSPASRAFARIGLSPTFHEKTQAGLEILDAKGHPLFAFRDPRCIYPNFESVPPLIVSTLLFIENRSLLDSSSSFRNPTIEWSRLGRAGLDYAFHTVNRDAPVVGGSTLATQLEKMRHSPGGRTRSPIDKVRQIASASLRVYQNGPRTLEAQKGVVLDYINSIPLSATPAWGEVTGLADGLKVWYNADFDSVNQLLSTPSGTLPPQKLKDQARAYRQVLSLFLALRQPSRRLVEDPILLAQQTDRYLRALCNEGVITPQLRDAALAEVITPRRAAGNLPAHAFAPNKAADNIRARLLSTLALPNSYALDRLDLKVQTVIDGGSQQSVTQFLESLSDPEQVRKAGLLGDRLLSLGNPARVTYAFTLYERGDGYNLLRVQADNLNQPLNINEGTKLQLGSTAKLRTLITYLEVIEQLHSRYSRLTQDQLALVPVPPDDRLTQWAIEYLGAAKDKSLNAMLQAALERKYSGNPGEAFFTAGGLHTFANFERSENFQIMSVRQAFEQSVNLVFIRLMRDITNYYIGRTSGMSLPTETPGDNPVRQAFLRRFAEKEGAQVLRQFHARYQDQTPEEAFITLVRKMPRSSFRLAAAYRIVKPEADLQAFAQFLRQQLPEKAPASSEIASLYEKYGPDKFNLNDRGYLAGVHPLELWLIAYRMRHPQASFPEILANSVTARHETYTWLYRPRLRQAQDKRIRIVMEEDAFAEIWKDWRRLGYPFDRLVPSYATSIGVSGDTPAALAELAGILINDGVKYPKMTVQSFHFGPGTPADTLLSAGPGKGERVLHPEIARLVREAMTGVVERGTGRRAFRSVVLPDGKVVPVAGKTGTGDNRFKVFAPGGGLVSSRVVNRTAAFVFLIGDRYFGTVTAYVDGEAAAEYGFTSSLAVQVFKDLAPRLARMIASTPPAPGVSGANALPDSLALARK